MFKKNICLSAILLAKGLLIGGFLFTAAASTNAAKTQTSMNSKTPPLVQCPASTKQANTFALCATATCWTIDDVAYCKCEIKNEQSISESFSYQENGKTKDVCNLLLEGNNNGFTISTYATPRQVESDYRPKVEKLGPPMGYYTCSSQAKNQAYGAQCDGGVCFTSTQGKNFPGLGHINENEIVCSCPPTLNQIADFQIAGPWSCKPGDTNENNQCCSQDYYNDMCNVTSIKKTGTALAVSAPIGVPKLLSKLLDGSVPSLNSCRFNK